MAIIKVVLLTIIIRECWGACEIQAQTPPYVFNGGYKVAATNTFETTTQPPNWGLINHSDGRVEL